MEQRHGLTHHVTSHQGAVTIIVLQERNEASRDRSDLLRTHVHKIHLVGGHHWIIGILTAFHHLADEMSVGSERRVALTDNLVFLLFCRQINDVFVIHVDD